MVTLQGYHATPTRRRTRSATATTQVATWRRSSPTSRRESRGMKMNVALDASEGAAKRTRSARRCSIFRGGTHDFACATCHGEDGKRIRLQDLPNLTTNGRRAEGVHDVARVSRVAGRAAHVPVAALRLLPPAALSRSSSSARDASIALTMFLARNANGAAFDAPAIKR